MNNGRKFNFLGDIKKLFFVFLEVPNPHLKRTFRVFLTISHQKAILKNNFTFFLGFHPN